MTRDLRALPASATPAERLAALFAAHADFVARMLRRLGIPGADVDDAVQEVFLVAKGRLDGLPEEKERALLFSIARRVAANVRRNVARTRERVEDMGESFEPPSPAEPNVEDAIDQRRARDVLDALLDALPADLRAVFVLFELEQMTHAEIADFTELAPGTVASRLRRARELFENAVHRLRVKHEGNRLL